MEIHHAHHHDPPQHKEKLWKHYALEFFMLFLAVFCGFLAENYREERVDRRREREFIVSMVEDLKKDTANVNSDVVGFNKLVVLIDSIFMNFDELSGTFNPQLYEQLDRALEYPDFIYHDKTIQQLKSAGEMRLIQNKTALDAMIDYDSNIRDYLPESDIIERIFEDYQTIYYETLDIQKIKADLKSNTPAELEKARKNYLITKDPEKLARFRNKLFQFQAYAEYNPIREADIKEKGVALIQILKKEYHLE